MQTLVPPSSRPTNPSSATIIRLSFIYAAGLFLAFLPLTLPADWLPSIAILLVPVVSPFVAECTVRRRYPFPAGIGFRALGLVLSIVLACIVISVRFSPDEAEGYGMIVGLSPTFQIPIMLLFAAIRRERKPPLPESPA